MIKKVKYGMFLSRNGNIVTVTTDKGKSYGFVRNGVSENEMRAAVGAEGKDTAVRRFAAEGKLLPMYGGKIEL